VAEGSPRDALDVARLARLPAGPSVALIALLALTIVCVALPPRPQLLHVVQKLGHPGVFAVIALLGLALVRRWRPAGAPLADYLLVLAGCALLGGLTELAQSLTHRDPALGDVGLDVQGACFALSLALAFDRRVHRARPARRALAALLAAGLGVLIASPLAQALAAYGARASAFPVLFEPRGPLDLYFVDAGGQSIALGPGSGGERALRVSLRGEPFAGITLGEPSPDWRGYAEVRIDVANPGSEALDLLVRIEDARHDQSFADRFNEEFLLEPGTRRVLEIPLERIAAAPHGRRLDLAHVARLGLARVGPGADRFERYRNAQR